MLDGVFAEEQDGALAFHPADPLSDEEVARLLATIFRRVRRLLARRGLDVDDPSDVDPFAEKSPVLADLDGTGSGGAARRCGSSRSSASPTIASRAPWPGA